MGFLPMTAKMPDKTLLFEEIRHKLSSNGGKLSFKEVLDLVDKVDSLAALEDDPELRRKIETIRAGLIEQQDKRAEEIGMSQKWKEAKKGQNALLAMDRLLGSGTGQEFFDGYRNLPLEQRTALQSLEKEGTLDLKAVLRDEPIADALREDSMSKLFWTMLRLHPFQMIPFVLKVGFLRVGWMVVMIAGIAFLLWDKNAEGLILIAVSVLLVLWKKYRRR